MHALRLLPLCLLPLAGCAEGVGDPAPGAGFGSAVMTNVAVQSGQAGPLGTLQQRFAAEAPTTITFAFNSAALDAQAQAVLAQQARWIRQFPEAHFRVYGHTDLVGSPAYNQALGLRRAQAAVAYLIAQGVGRTQLEAVASFGETRPLIATTAPERANRRTVTEIDGFMAGHPNVLNGKYAAVIMRDYIQSAQAGPRLSAATEAVSAAGASTP